MPPGWKVVATPLLESCGSAREWEGRPKVSRQACATRPTISGRAASVVTYVSKARPAT